MRINCNLETGWEILKIAPCEKADLEKANTESGWLLASRFPMQVHDILLDHGVLPEEVRLGWCESAEWVADYDWLYRCAFKRKRKSDKTIIHFGGLDTFADIYLNGKLIGQTNDFYLPYTFDVTNDIEEDNILMIHFHRANGEVGKYTYKEEWRETILPCKAVRKPIHDFESGVKNGSNYQGAVHWYQPVGVYQRITVSYFEEAHFTEEHFVPRVHAPYEEGTLIASLKGKNGSRVTVEVLDEGGECVAFGERQVTGEWEETIILKVTDPKLWYPRTFGPQTRYTAIAALYDNDRNMFDRLERKIGFREVVSDGDLGFKINGHLIRLYGGSTDPFQGYSHCFDSKRVNRILNMIENANMNCLRMWGEGIPYDDELYEQADQRGVLIWQEFFLGHGAYPDTEEYRELCTKEAIALIKRLRWRPCLLMWCGGNETIMGSEYVDKKKHVFGAEMVLSDFPKLVEKYDKGRYYHVSSPYGGEWANDPRKGDFHVYEGVWAYPYAEYPNFISEEIKTAAPCMHSLKKMIKGDVWPKGYSPIYRNDDQFPMPDTWMERSHHPANGHLKTGPYWEYYDADNGYDHLYRFAASAAQAMRKWVEKVRQGSRDGNVKPEERIKGHLACKLLDTWPKVYCSIIDFFGEGFHSYYAVAAAQRPVALSFQTTPNGYRLWLSNDSPKKVLGKAKFGFFDIEKNEFTQTKEFFAEMDKENSGIILNLDPFTFFPKTNLLYASFEDEENGITDFVIDYADIERHYKFPKAELSVELLGDELLIRTDRFARCIEITAEKDGNEFGWLFSDNYFDFLPGDCKRVKIKAGGSGTIRVKPHYSHEVTVEYKEE